MKNAIEEAGQWPDLLDLKHPSLGDQPFRKVHWQKGRRLHM